MSLQGCPPVHRLECARAAVNQTGAELLGAALQHNHTLQALFLGTASSGNNLGPDGIAPICTALHSNRSLTELFVPTNKLGEDGALMLAEVVRANSCLTSLDGAPHSCTNDI